LELGQAALALAKENETDTTVVQMARLLALADQALGDSREVLAMRSQYLNDIMQYAVEAARQMAFLMEQSHDAVHSLSHRSVRESFIGKRGGKYVGQNSSRSCIRQRRSWKHRCRQQRRRRCSRCMRVYMDGERPCGVAAGQPFWRQTASRADRWRDMGATEYEVRAIRFGIIDLPSTPFTSGLVLPIIPQNKNDLEFGKEDLRIESASGIYEEVSAEEVRAVVETGRMVSSAITTWQGKKVETKVHLVINFVQQSKHWPKRSVKMETLPGFALNLVKNDYLMSLDVVSGYWQFYIHPRISDYF
jgi:hypothetical protein